MKLSLPNILSYIKTQFPDAEIQAETNQVVFPIKIGQATYYVFIKIYEESRLLQIMTFFPTQYNENSEADLSCSLHYINGQVDIPGFGMEFNSKSFFYRLLIPSHNEEIEEKLLEQYIKGTYAILKSYGTYLFAIALNKMSFQDLKKVSTQ